MSTLLDFLKGIDSTITGAKGGPGSGRNPSDQTVGNTEADMFKAPGHINPLIHQENGPKETFTPGKDLSDSQKQSFVEYMTNKGLVDQIPEDYKDYTPSDLSKPVTKNYHDLREYGNNFDPDTGKFKIRAKRG